MIWIKTTLGSSCCGAAATKTTSIHEDEGLIPGLPSLGISICHRCGPKRKKKKKKVKSKKKTLKFPDLQTRFNSFQSLMILLSLLRNSKMMAHNVILCFTPKPHLMDMLMISEMAKQLATVRE